MLHDVWSLANQRGMKYYLISRLNQLALAKMADVSDTTVNSDIFVDDIKTAIIAIKESKKRPDTKAIWQYLSNKLASNIDESTLVKY